MDTPKGYKLADLEDAFERYLPPSSPKLSIQGATPPQTNGEKGYSDFSRRNTASDVAAEKVDSSHGEKECGGVAVSEPSFGAGAEVHGTNGVASGAAGIEDIEEF
jgi:hypothetical protein